jgi:hypothetical protein
VNAQLRSRGLRPAQDLAADKPHGVRLRYIAGCRCALCRKANSRYENERQQARRAGDWNGIVSADSAREHMLKLSRQGVGRRAIQAVTDIADTILQEVRSGRRTRIRARTARKILAVDKAMASDHALVPAGRTRRRIALLLEEGYTEAFLAKELGYATARLQFPKDQITVRNAERVRALYVRLTT